MIIVHHYHRLIILFLFIFLATDHAIYISLIVCLVFFIVEFLAASATSVGNLPEIQLKGGK